MSRTRRKTVLRVIAAPFVVAPPGGARIRTRLRPTEQEASVLEQVGDHLGRLYRADLAARIRLGDVAGKDNDRTARKRGITAASTSRWAGTITRTAEDQYQLAMRGLRADVDTLGRAIHVLDARIATPVAGHARRVKGYPTRAERAREQHRRSILVARLDAAARRLAAGTPAVVAGGRRLARLRHHLNDADLTTGPWRQQWDAARRGLPARHPRRRPGRRAARAVDHPPADRPVRRPTAAPPGATPLAQLTNRDREAVVLVARGLSNDEIADRMVISPVTAKTHVNRAMTNLHARDRAQLVVVLAQRIRSGAPMQSVR